MNVQVNKAFMGENIKLEGLPEIRIEAQGEKEIQKVELLRNSRVVKSWIPENGNKMFSVQYTDEHFELEKEVLYYYVRVTQKDEHLAWSSPVFLERV